MFSWLVKLLYSTFYIEYYNTVWIVFQEKYEVFRHLIKDNKYENNKLFNKQYGTMAEKGHDCKHSPFFLPLDSSFFSLQNHTRRFFVQN